MTETACSDRATRPRVDVGVVTWNTSDLTVAALRRLLDHDSGCDIRLLVRDNGSGDGTAEAVARHVPEAELDAGSRNLGFAAGMNTLLRRSDAPWFLALNSDAWPEPGALAALVGAGERLPRAAATAPRLERPDGSVEHSTHRFPSLRVSAMTAVGGYRWWGRKAGDDQLLAGVWQHDRPRLVDWAVGAALLMRRAAIDDVGPFDERYFMYVEDLDWCWRAHRAGWQIAFEPDAVVRHVGNASGAQQFGRARPTAYMRNTYDFYRRHHGPLSTVAFRLLNLTGAARLYLLARARGDATEVGTWADHVRANLGGP